MLLKALLADVNPRDPNAPPQAYTSQAPEAASPNSNPLDDYEKWKGSPGTEQYDQRKNLALAGLYRVLDEEIGMDAEPKLLGNILAKLLLPVQESPSPDDVGLLRLKLRTGTLIEFGKLKKATPSA